MPIIVRLFDFNCHWFIIENYSYCMLEIKKKKTTAKKNIVLYVTSY